MDADGSLKTQPGEEPLQHLVGTQDLLPAAPTPEMRVTTCCCASLAAPCWCQWDEAPRGPGAAREAPPRPRVSLSHAAGTKERWGSVHPAARAERPRLAGHPAGVTVFTYTGERKIVTDVSRKNGMVMFDPSPKTQQAAYLHQSCMRCNAYNT